jgi:hypothetical protein
MPIASIDVWVSDLQTWIRCSFLFDFLLQLVGKAECIIDLAQQPFLNATANLWSRSSGNPLLPHDAKMRIAPFKGKFPAGTYVFVRKFPILFDQIKSGPNFHSAFRLSCLASRRRGVSNGR